MARFCVRELAEARGLDAAKLARRADLGYATVYAIWLNDESKSPNFKTLSAIAKVLGVKIADLIVEDDIPNEEPQLVGAA